MSIKRYLLILIFLAAYPWGILPAQEGSTPKIEITEVSAAKKAESTMIPHFMFELRISGLKDKYIGAREDTPARVTDDKGRDLRAAGQAELEKRNKEGFFSTTPNGWEFNDLRFNEIDNAFRARFNAYASPSPGSNYVTLQGKLSVSIRKPGNTKEIKLKNVDPKKGDTLTAGGKKIYFIESGSMSSGENVFLTYTLNPDLAVEEAITPGIRLPDGISKGATEIYVPEKVKKFDLVLKIADTEVITIPLDLKITLGM